MHVLPFSVQGKRHKNTLISCSRGVQTKLCSPKQINKSLDHRSVGSATLGLPGSWIRNLVKISTKQTKKILLSKPKSKVWSIKKESLSKIYWSLKGSRKKSKNNNFKILLSSKDYIILKKYSWTGSGFGSWNRMMYPFSPADF